MEIKQRLIPTKYTNIRPRIKLVPKYITVHETANVSRGADAAAHASLLERGNSRTASWHFSIYDKQLFNIYQKTRLVGMREMEETEQEIGRV
jgi:N-acetylmuramoyl-L-alanine amidase